MQKGRLKAGRTLRCGPMNRVRTNNQRHSRGVTLKEFTELCLFHSNLLEFSIYFFLGSMESYENYPHQ